MDFGQATCSFLVMFLSTEVRMSTFYRDNLTLTRKLHRGQRYKLSLMLLTANGSDMSRLKGQQKGKSLTLVGVKASA